MSRESASAIVQGAVASNVPNERIKSAGDLTSSGSIRILADKHTFQASAVPLPDKGAFGFEVSHFGTMPFRGPSYAQRIYDSIIQRADASGQRISTQR
jgi:hypothetical protein